MAKPHFRIGLDFDDVLISSADHTIKLHNERYGTKLTRDNWYDNRTNVKPWKVENFQELVANVFELQALDDFLLAEPLKDAQAVLRRLKDQGHELIVVTGRADNLRTHTRALLDKYYGDIVGPDSLYFTDHYSHARERLDKGDIAKELKLTHFIDDFILHVNNVAEAGVKTILFDSDYHWSKGDMNKGAIRLKSWKEIGEYFDAESARQ